jgi:hypothetical protein
MQRWIQRSMLHLQDVIGPAFDRVRDGVTVRRAKHERPQDQQIEGALQHVTASPGLSSHGLVSYH